MVNLSSKEVFSGVVSHFGGFSPKLLSCVWSQSTQKPHWECIMAIYILFMIHFYFQYFHVKLLVP